MLVNWLVYNSLLNFANLLGHTSYAGQIQYSDAQESDDCFSYL